MPGSVRRDGLKPNSTQVDRAALFGEAADRARPFRGIGPVGGAFPAKARAAYWRGRAVWSRGALSDERRRRPTRAASALPSTITVSSRRSHRPGGPASGRYGSVGDGPGDGAREPGRADDPAAARRGPEGIRAASRHRVRTFGRLRRADRCRRRSFVRLGDAPAVLAIGRTATARGLPLEQHAFPTFGIPVTNPCRAPRTRRWSTPSRGRRAPSTRGPSPAPTRAA